MKKYDFLSRLWVIPFIGLALISINASAQRSSRDQAIENYAVKYSTEKAYLHYDKPAYTVGETIWFKAYIMNEIAASTDTKTFYTDWFDDKGNLLQHTVSPVLDAVTTGQFDIPVNYPGKYIHVRAYTRWMLNFDSAFLYTKDIRILGNDKAGTNAAKVSPVATLTLFPEGGDLIAGIACKVAFKANDQFGKPVKVRGVVQDGQGKKIDSLKVMHDGMGYFFIVPQAGATYTVSWKDEKDVARTTTLPAVKPQGLGLQIALAGPNRRFLVSYKPESIVGIDSVHIVGTMFQHQVFRVTRATNTPEIRGSVPLQDLPSGLLTFTLFDKNWNPLAERITFVDNGEYSFKPTFEVQHWGLNKRARNEIKISVPDSIVASMSVSVTDQAIGTDSANIISHLLLSSELKGDIYKPDYYFSSANDSIAQHLDLVMLTHGWRRIKWDLAFSNNFPKPLYAKDTAYMTLSGNVVGAGQIAPGSTVVLMIKQKDTKGDVLAVPIDQNGYFNDHQTLIFDTAQVYYQFQNKDLKSASVMFMPDRLKVPQMRRFVGNNGLGFWMDTTGFYRQYILANEANTIAERLRVKTLEEVIVKSKTKTPIQIMDEKYSRGLFAGGDSYQFDMINDIAAQSALNIFSYLQGRVAGLSISQSGSNVSMSWRGGTPSLFLDEMPTDVDMISNINVRDVAYIKVFRPPFMGATGGGSGGAIAIYTRRGGDVKSDPGKGLSNNKVEGYTPIREFYSPNYASFNAKNEERDLRTTLYWNPSVQLAGSKREVVLTFYNNDVTKSFRVVIEGMTSDGRLAHVEEIME